MDTMAIMMFRHSNLKLSYTFLFMIRIVRIRTPDLDAFDSK